MSFDSNVNCEPTLRMDGLPKNVKNCFLKLCQLFQRLSVRLHNKSQQGFVTPNGLHGEAVESFSGYARSQVGGLAMVLLSCLAFFFNCCCPWRSFTTTLLTWKIASSVCLPVTHQRLLIVHVIFGLREISCGRILRENLSSRRHGFLGSFFPGFVVLYLRDCCQL